jgi:hypothetical protein
MYFPILHIINVGTSYGRTDGRAPDRRQSNHFSVGLGFQKARLRLVNAFALLAETKIANSTKNFGRAGIAFNLFLFIASNDAQ